MLVTSDFEAYTQKIIYDYTTDEQYGVLVVRC